MATLQGRTRTQDWHPGREARSEARSGSGWYRVLARAGLVAKGASFAIVGALALELAAGKGGSATSRQGALQALAGEPFGKVLLILLAIGFACYALWRFVQAFAERESGGDKEKAKQWAKRLAYVGRGVIYAGLTASTVQILLGSGGQQSQNQRAHGWTATVLSWPGGQELVGAVGVGIFAVGLWNGYRGLARKFEERWRTAAMSQTERRWGGRVGVVGHLARAVVFCLIGVFVTKAAIQFNPKDAIGLDGALQKLAHASYGPYLLGLTAAGLVCYGLYCLVDARYRDVSVDGGGSDGSREPSSGRRPRALAAR